MEPLKEVEEVLTEVKTGMECNEALVSWNEAIGFHDWKRRVNGKVEEDTPKVNQVWNEMKL
jgi:hypothetical protein